MNDTRENSLLNPIVDFAHVAIRELRDALSSVNLDTNSNRQVYAYCLHASTVNLCGGCLSLAHSGFTAGIPILLRSMYEAVVDVECLAKDPTYSDVMDFANLKEWLKVYENRDDASELQRRHEAGGMPHFIANNRKHLHALKARGVKKMSFQERFTFVGRGKEYLTAYADLCLDAHNNVSALGGRHVVPGKGFDVLGDGNLTKLLPYIHRASLFALETGNTFHETFQTNVDLSHLKMQWRHLDRFVGVVRRQQ